MTPDIEQEAENLPAGHEMTTIQRYKVILACIEALAHTQFWHFKKRRVLKIMLKRATL